jgi:hypothetical protein
MEQADSVDNGISHYPGAPFTASRKIFPNANPNKTQSNRRIPATGTPLYTPALMHNRRVSRTQNPDAPPPPRSGIPLKSVPSKKAICETNPTPALTATAV